MKKLTLICVIFTAVEGSSYDRAISSFRTFLENVSSLMTGYHSLIVNQSKGIEMVWTDIPGYLIKYIHINKNGSFNVSPQVIDEKRDWTGHVYLFGVDKRNNERIIFRREEPDFGVDFAHYLIRIDKNGNKIFSKKVKPPIWGATERLTARLDSSGKIHIFYVNIPGYELYVGPTPVVYWRLNEDGETEFYHVLENEVINRGYPRVDLEILNGGNILVVIKYTIKKETFLSIFKMTDDFNILWKREDIPFREKSSIKVEGADLSKIPLRLVKTSAGKIFLVKPDHKNKEVYIMEFLPDGEPLINGRGLKVVSALSIDDMPDDVIPEIDLVYSRGEVVNEGTWGWRKDYWDLVIYGVDDEGNFYYKRYKDFYHSKKPQPKK